MTDPARTAPMRTILVGVDESPGAQRALAWATARAHETSDTRLLVAHVLTFSTELRRDAGLETTTLWRRDLERTVRDQWTVAARAAGVDVETVVCEADSPAAGLLSLAGRDAVDLIVLGTHGHGGLADRLLGATTYKVSHAATTPVVIVPVDWRPAVAA
jgi:nucleotide-binding universal stress UspA family protein